MTIRKFFIILFLFIAGVKYGSSYLLSDRFQEYADRTKAPWTCQFENVMGHFYMMMSEYGTAQMYFGHTLKRCKDPELVQAAEFETARCLEGQGETQAAVDRYYAFAEKYKGTKRARTALRAGDLLKN